MTAKKKPAAENTEKLIERHDTPLGHSLPAATPAPESAASHFLSIIDRASKDPRTNIEKLRALLDMQKEMIAEERRVAFSLAMMEAQAEMEPIVKSDKGERKNYAKLERIDAGIRPIYTRHGFSLTFNSKKSDDKTIYVSCKCFHKSGHTEFYELEGGIDNVGPKGEKNKTDIQGLGSSVSYLRRFLTMMIFNVVVVDEDNDGNLQEERGKTKSRSMFDNAVREEAPAVSEAVFEEVEDDKWDGRTIHIGKKTPMQLRPEGTMQDAGEYLLEIISEQKTQAERLKLINTNLPLLRALTEKNMGSIVAEMHAAVDQGA